MFKPRPLTICLLFTDASDEGYGGFVLKHLNKQICSSKFDKCDKETRSTVRELNILQQNMYLPVSATF